MTRTARTLTLLAAAIALGACSFSASVGEGAVEAGEVEAQASQQFSEQFPVDSVDCPEDLPAEVDATITCTLVSEGKEFEMTATTTTVNDDDVDFDLEITAEL